MILFIKHGLHFRCIGCYITRVVLDLVFYHLTRHGLFVFAHRDVSIWFAQPFSPLEGGTSLIEGGSAGHMMHILEVFFCGSFVVSPAERCFVNLGTSPAIARSSTWCHIGY